MRRTGAISAFFLQGQRSRSAVAKLTWQAVQNRLFLRSTSENEVLSDMTHCAVVSDLTQRGRE